KVNIFGFYPIPYSPPLTPGIIYINPSDRGMRQSRSSNWIALINCRKGSYFLIIPGRGGSFNFCNCKQYFPQKNGYRIQRLRGSISLYLRSQFICGKVIHTARRAFISLASRTAIESLASGSLPAATLVFNSSRVKALAFMFEKFSNRDYIPRGIKSITQGMNLLAT